MKGSSNNGPQSDNLIALFFGVGRLLKSGWSQDAALLPSFLHMEALRFVADKREPTMHDLALYLKVAAPTVTALVNSMVKDQVLQREQDPHDRRRIRLVLTKEGTHILARTCEIRERAFEEVIAPLSDADRKALARILSSIIASRP